ncbi:MAG: hypothetical protein JSU73_01785 [candidate division WOR-3 bacterium]|nr:MAG: hypothetical protein JSU73_01785 [candidate division WOR-3 bacterium]
MKRCEDPLPHGVMRLVQAVPAEPGHRVCRAELQGRTHSSLVKGQTGNILDACTDFLRHLSPGLEALDLPWGRCSFQASNQGIGEPLYDPEHFSAAVERQAYMATKDGQLHGTLATAGKAPIVLATGGKDPAGRVRIDFARIKRAHATVSSAELFGGHKQD